MPQEPAEPLTAELATGPDTFVLWVDRCRPAGEGGQEVAAGRKNVPAAQPQQELRTRRGVAANKRVTPTKPAAPERRRERIAERRDREKETRCRKVFSFLFLLQEHNP